MTKQEACIKSKILNEDGSYIEGKMFDYALPQPWLDEINKITKEECVKHFVWLYDSMNKCMGRPFSVTPKGWNLLEKYNRNTGARWPIEKCKYKQGVEIKIIYLGHVVDIKIKDTNLYIKGNHDFVYSIAKFLDDNAILDTKAEYFMPHGRSIQFEIEEEKFKTITFQLKG